MINGRGRTRIVCVEESLSRLVIGPPPSPPPPPHLPRYVDDSGANSFFFLQGMAKPISHQPTRPPTNQDPVGPRILSRTTLNIPIVTLLNALLSRIMNYSTHFLQSKQSMLLWGWQLCTPCYRGFAPLGPEMCVWGDTFSSVLGVGTLGVVRIVLSIIAVYGCKLSCFYLFFHRSKTKKSCNLVFVGNVFTLKILNTAKPIL